MTGFVRHSILTTIVLSALFFAVLSISANWQFGQALGFDRVNSTMFGMIGVMFAVTSMTLPIVAAELWRNRHPVATCITAIIWLLPLTYGMLAFLLSPSLTAELSQKQALALIGVWGLVQVIAGVLPLLIALLLMNQRQHPESKPVSAPTDNRNQEQSNLIRLNQGTPDNHPADPVTRFLRACSQPAPGHRVTAKDFHVAYCLWCMNEGLNPHPLHVFGQALAIHQIRKIKSRGRMVYCDLSLTFCTQKRDVPQRLPRVA